MTRPLTAYDVALALRTTGLPVTPLVTSTGVNSICVIEAAGNTQVTSILPVVVFVAAVTDRGVSFGVTVIVTRCVDVPEMFVAEMTTT